MILSTFWVTNSCFRSTVPVPLLVCVGDAWMLLFLTFSALVAHPKKTTYFTRWPIPLMVC